MPKLNDTLPPISEADLREDLREALNTPYGKWTNFPIVSELIDGPRYNTKICTGFVKGDLATLTVSGKAFRDPKIDPHIDLGSFCEAAVIQSQMKHPCIPSIGEIKFLRFKDGVHPALVNEQMSGFPLGGMDLSLPELSDVVTQVADCLDFFHRVRYFYHTTCDNILVTRKENGAVKASLFDIELATVILPRKPYNRFDDYNALINVVGSSVWGMKGKVEGNKHSELMSFISDYVLDENATGLNSASEFAKRFEDIVYH